MNYLPQAERLTIVIMKAKNLETTEDSYVKVLLPFELIGLTTFRFLFSLMWIYWIFCRFSDLFDSKWQADEEEKEQPVQVGRSEESGLERGVYF